MSRWGVERRRRPRLRTGARLLVGALGVDHQHVGGGVSGAREGPLDGVAAQRSHPVGQREFSVAERLGTIRAERQRRGSAAQYRAGGGVLDHRLDRQVERPGRPRRDRLDPVGDRDRAEQLVRPLARRERVATRGVCGRGVDRAAVGSTRASATAAAPTASSPETATEAATAAPARVRPVMNPPSSTAPPDATSAYRTGSSPPASTGSRRSRKPAAAPTGIGANRASGKTEYEGKRM